MKDDEQRPETIHSFFSVVLGVFTFLSKLLTLAAASLCFCLESCAKYFRNRSVPLRLVRSYNFIPRPFQVLCLLGTFPAYSASRRVSLYYSARRCHCRWTDCCWLCRLLVIITKMDKEQEQLLPEQGALLAESRKVNQGEDEQTLAEQEASRAEIKKVYLREKEPETKEGQSQEGEGETSTGLPIGPGPASTAIGVPVPHTPWSTGLFQCFGTGDEHFSSDLEVCVLGFGAPCVLYGSNMERLYPNRRFFAEDCLLFSCLYFIGLLLFNANNLAPAISSRSRVALRHKYNLEGYGQYCFGCSGSPGEKSRERCDTCCDLSIHGLYCLYPFALAQEGRELRRRTLHPAFQPYVVITMAPPVEQIMSV